MNVMHEKFHELNFDFWNKYAQFANSWKRYKFISKIVVSSNLLFITFILT